MRISEAAKRTGLTISNIRFYEKKGLLLPRREGEGKYRDYSEDDILRLKKIILYRKMDITIDTIYMLLKGEVSMENILDSKEKELIEQQKMIQGSIHLCRKMKEETDPENIDVDYYLNYVHEEEKQGRYFAEVKEWIEDFAEFTQFTNFQGDKYIGKLFFHPKIVRLMFLLWGICGLAAPIVAVIDKWQEYQRIPVTFLVVIIPLYASLLFYFLKFRREKRKQEKEEEILPQSRIENN